MTYRPSDHYIRGLPLLEGLSGDTLSDLLTRSQFRHLKAGDVLVDANDGGDELYILLLGRMVALSMAKDGAPRLLGEIAAGETVGEMAAITGQPRTARVMAIRDSWLLCIENGDLKRLIEEHPQFLMRLSQLTIRRMQGMIQHESPEAPVRTLTLVNLSPRLEMKRFLDLIASTMSRVGKTIQADPALVEGVEPSHYGDRISQWLEQQDARYQLLPTGFGNDDWDRVCVGQADRVVLVTSDEDIENQDHRDHHLWGAITANPMRKIETIIFHMNDHRRPLLSASFLDRHQLTDCFHLRAGVRADYARIARTITGHATGVVLGGGGARGFAHVGAIRALQENGVDIDHASGTSIGAYIGALLAAGMGPEQMSEVNQRMFVDSNPTNDYRFPRVSLMAGRKVDNRLEEVFGDLHIRDLWLPFFCVSADLANASVHVHDRGLAWRAVRASLSIPGVFPPVVEDNHMLVDGGIVNNLPVLLARQRRPGRVIAVDVSGGGKLDADHAKAPGIFDILIASGLFGNEVSRGAAVRDTDLLIKPELGDFQLLNWKPMKQIEQAGYEATLRALDTLAGSADGVPE